MPIEGIDFFLDENLEGKGELLPLIELLKARQEHPPTPDEEVPWEDIDE